MARGWRAPGAPRETAAGPPREKRPGWTIFRRDLGLVLRVRAPGQEDGAHPAARRSARMLVGADPAAREAAAAPPARRDRAPPPRRLPRRSPPSRPWASSRALASRASAVSPRHAASTNASRSAGRALQRLAEELLQTGAQRSRLGGAGLTRKLPDAAMRAPWRESRLTVVGEIGQSLAGLFDAHAGEETHLDDADGLLVERGQARQGLVEAPAGRGSDPQLRQIVGERDPDRPPPPRLAARLRAGVIDEDLRRMTCAASARNCGSAVDRAARECLASSM